MTIETKELVISEELKRKVEMICRFAYVEYSITNGNIKSIKNTNIAYVKPHIVRINNINYLLFDNSDYIFINGYDEKIRIEIYRLYVILKMIVDWKLKQYGKFDWMYENLDTRIDSLQRVKNKGKY